MARSLSLIHLTRDPAGTAAPPLLLLLHGVGSHEGDLMGLAPYLDERLLVVSPRAPHTLAPGMYAWFAVQLDPFNPVIDAAQAEASRHLLVRFIDEVVDAYGADPHRVYLLGFSQGAIMSLSILLTAPEKVAGIVGMSGRILPEVLPQMAAPARLAGIPVLVVHGVADPILPIHHGRATSDLLSGLPVALTYREYPMGHEVSAESLADVTAWLRGQLDRRGHRAEASP